ncbi:MAG TPA: LD-carboxypeptidase, partial [Synergistales bacterium]|nr:LD-carboxypeptidase [Synergistales bacterium]
MDSIEKAVRITEDMGFRVKLSRSCYESEGYHAGTDFVRADDINRAFLDPEVSGIFCVRGGDGAIRLPQRLDLDAIYRNPKVFLGYSDVTILHLVLNRPRGFITFHGPMPATDFISSYFSGYVRDGLLKAVTGVEPLGEIAPCPGGPAMETLVPGTAEGELTGGNLALICAL